MRGAGPRPHAPVRHARAALPRCAIAEPTKAPRGGVVALARVPGLRPGELLSRAPPTCPGGRRCWRATAACWPNRPPAPAAQKPDRRASRRSAKRPRRGARGRSGPCPPAGGPNWKRRACPPQAPVGAQRPRAGARRPPAGNARAAAAGGQPRAGLGRAARRGAGAHEHLPRAAAGDRGRARRPVRRGRRDAPLGADPGGRRDRPRRPAAARVDLQDGDRLGRADGAPREPAHGLPLRHLRDPRRGQAQQRQRRGMRRDARNRPSRCRATRCSRRWGSSSAPRGWWRRAERFGFNSPTGHPRGAPRARSRAAGEIQGELDVGSTAIGQGSVLATPLQMATVAATIADGGQPPPAHLPRPGPAAAPGAGALTGVGGAHRAAADDRRGARGHRHGGGDPRRDGGRQDRHRRTEERLPDRPARRAGKPRTGERSAGSVRGGEAKPATPTPGSRPSRPRCTRAWSCACCSSKTAPAATPPRPSPARC